MRDIDKIYDQGHAYFFDGTDDYSFIQSQPAAFLEGYQQAFYESRDRSPNEGDNAAEWAWEYHFDHIYQESRYNPAPSPATTPEKAVSRVSFAATSDDLDTVLTRMGIVAFGLIILGVCGWQIWFSIQ